MARRPRRGRPESTSLIRRVLSLVAGLEHEGDTINVEGVQDRFGVGEAEARRTIQLIIGAAYNGDLSLPIRVSDDGESVSLAFGSAVTGKPLRLTIAETEAIRRAMDLMGLEEDNSIRIGVERAFASGAAPYAAHPFPFEDEEQSELLRVIGEAIEEGTSLGFLYRGSEDAAPARRRAVPIDIRHENNVWYLDAEDLDRRAFRTFRLDRMDAAEKTLEVEAIASGSDSADGPLPSRPQDSIRMVRLAFNDSFYLEHLDWPGFVEETRAEQERDCSKSLRVVGSIPYYGGSWLLRHIAACRGTVDVLDDELADELEAFVEGLLNG